MKSTTGLKKKLIECYQIIFVVELRTGMEAQLGVLDDRLKIQEQEVGDIMEILKKRAEIERKYGRELETLARQMRGKHKVRDLLVIDVQEIVLMFRT